MELLGLFDALQCGGALFAEAEVSRAARQLLQQRRHQDFTAGCFVTPEDATGTSNSILMPDIFKRFRATLHRHAVLQIEGPLQPADGVTHIRARKLEPVSLTAHLPDAHDHR